MGDKQNNYVPLEVPAKHGQFEEDDEEVGAEIEFKAEREEPKATTPNLFGGHGHSHGGAHGHSHGIKNPFSGAAFKVVVQILKLAKDDRLVLAVGMVSLIISTLINITMPYTMTYVLQTALEPDMHWSHIAILAAIIMGVFTFGAFLTGVRVYCFQVGGERVIRRLRTRLFSMVVEQSMAFFDFMEPGEIVSRLSADCELLRVTLTVTLVLVFRFGIQVFGGVALLLYISWQLTLVLVAILPVLAVVAVFYSKRAKFLGHLFQNSVAASSSLATEVLSAIRHVRAFDQERHEVARYKGRLDTTYGYAQKLGFASAFFIGGTELGSYIAVVAVLLFATYLVLEGDLTLEFITSFVLYSVYVAHAVGALSNQIAELSRAVGATERVFMLLSTVAVHPPLSQVIGGQQVKIRGDIEFEEASFVYPAHSRLQSSTDEKVSPRISKVSFHVRTGETLGVIGPSGAGKSTLLALLLRFYELESGAIKLDGQNLSSLDPSWVRRNVGFVSQEPTLFNTTIFENIAYGNPAATLEEVTAAAKSARIHEFVANLPKGYKTLVGDRGSRLSGGQKQRIALARVFLKNAPIVLFDEPTSALDSENEQLVMETIKSLFQGRTCIIVSHSLELLRTVSKILVMAPGGIVEAVGTHDELRATSKTYARLFERT